MKISLLLKCILIGGLATALNILPARALSSERLAELRAKAEAGDGAAQYDLGVAYADPREVQGNILEAYVWFSLAAENGAPGRAYKVVTDLLSPDQLAEGKKLLEQRRSEIAARRGIVATSNEPDKTAIKAELDKAGAQLAAAKKETQQLKTELEKTQQTALEKLKAERDELAATVAKYTNEISALRAASANFEGERNALKQQIADASNSSKESKATLSADLAATSARLKTAESDLAKAESTRKELSAENQRLTTQIKESSTTLAEKLAAYEKKLSDAKAELLNTQNKLAEAAKQTAEGAKDAAALRTANTELEAKVQKLAAEKDQAMTQSGKATNEAREQIEVLTASLKKMEQALGKATADRAALVAKNNEEIAGLKAASATLEKERNALKQQIEAAGGATKEVRTELATLKARLKTTESELAKAESSRKELTAENQRLANQNKESTGALAEKLAAYEEKLNATKSELLKAQGKLAEAATQSAKAGTDVASLRLANTELDAQVQKLAAEKDQLMVQSSKAANEAREQIETLNQKLKAVETSAAILAAVNSDLTKELAAMEATQLGTMREHLQQTQSQLTSIANENAEMKSRLSSKTVETSASGTSATTAGKKVTAPAQAP
ncbi:MAG: hypothetical protein QM790_20950 [Nibricoccus sp.]